LICASNHFVEKELGMDDWSVHPESLVLRCVSIPPETGQGVQVGDDPTQHPQNAGAVECGRDRGSRLKLATFVDPTEASNAGFRSSCCNPRLCSVAETFAPPILILHPRAAGVKKPVAVGFSR
jgi:hypothetical protein